MTDTPVVEYVGIARLLVDYRQRTGASYADIAKLTGLPRSTVGFLVNRQPPLRLDADTLARLRDGLDFTSEVIVEAATVSAGWKSVTEDARAPLPDRAQHIADRLDRLSDGQLRSLEALVGSFLDSGVQ